MGLDWIVQDKPIEGKQEEIRAINEEISKYDKMVSDSWDAFLKELKEDPPAIYPNALSDRFQKTSPYVQMSDKIRVLEKKRDSLVITPAMTLNAPIVGVDERATQYVMDIWEKSYKGRVPMDEYMEHYKGKALPELVESDGIGKFSGFFTSSDSFRGKLLGYVRWLDPELKEQAYEDHASIDLVRYGAALLNAAEENKGKEDNDIVVSAGKWCIFWGEHGHDMCAWY